MRPCGAHAAARPQAVSDERNSCRHWNEPVLYPFGISYRFHVDPKRQCGVIPCAPDLQDLITYIEGEVKKILADKEAGILGLIVEDEIIKKILQEKYKDEPLIHISDIRGSQGVEFETVFLVGASSLQSRVVVANEEMGRISRDLLYIGLTRAMNALHIVDTQSLRL